MPSASALYPMFFQELYVAAMKKAYNIHSTLSREYRKMLYIFPQTDQTASDSSQALHTVHTETAIQSKQPSCSLHTISHSNLQMPASKHPHFSPQSKQLSYVAVLYSQS